MKVQCRLEDIELENDDGRSIPGVQTTCSRCHHATQSFGDSSASIRRCLAMLREECPHGESNYYTVEES